MLSAIGSSTYRGSTTPERSAAGLQAQLARLQKELSDCVNCDTANTREGRDTIQNLSNRISALRARIEETDPSSNRSVSVPAEQAPDQASASQYQATASSSHRGGQQGSIVDIFA